MKEKRFYEVAGEVKNFQCKPRIGGVRHCLVWIGEAMRGLAYMGSDWQGNKKETVEGEVRVFSPVPVPARRCWACQCSDGPARANFGKETKKENQ